jgi:predicted DNA-binding transcriptional regulator AlpA
MNKGHIVIESFDDLVERGVVRNRSTLSRWQAKSGFPRAVKLGKRKAGFVRDEVDAWLARRIAARDAAS